MIIGTGSFFAYLLEFVLLFFIEQLFHINFELIILHDFDAKFESGLVFFAFCVSSSNENVALFWTICFVYRCPLISKKFFQLSALYLFECTLDCNILAKQRIFRLQIIIIKFMVFILIHSLNFLIIYNKSCWHGSITLF